MDSWAIGEADRYEVLNGDRAIEPCLLLCCFIGRGGVDIVSQYQRQLCRMSCESRITPPTAVPRIDPSPHRLGERVINLYNQPAENSSRMRLSFEKIYQGEKNESGR
jgi:hypothetical protein